jgi:hypothetical protein
MKSKMTKLGLAAGITLYAASVLASGNPTASGHGNLRISDYDNELRTFSFTAVQHKDGSVTGEAQLVNRFQDRHLHLTLNCMVITPEAIPGLLPVVNIAVISGTIDSDNTGVYTGWTGIFVVADAGEGVNVDAWLGGDWITLVQLYDPSLGYNANTFAWDSSEFWSWNPIEAGNIQVKP